MLNHMWELWSRYNIIAKAFLSDWICNCEQSFAALTRKTQQRLPILGKGDKGQHLSEKLEGTQHVC